MIRLYITPDEQQPYLLSFERSSLSVGSAEDSDVRLQAPGVSSRHFRLRRIGDDVVLEDLGSRNGTYVDNLRIVGSQVLSRTSEIRIAGYRIRIVDGGAGAAKPVEQRPVPVPAVTAPVVSKSIVVAPGPVVGKAVEASAPRGEPVVTPTEAPVVEIDPPPGFDAARVAAFVEPRARAWQERSDPVHLLGGEELREARVWVDCGQRVQPPAGWRERALVVSSQQAARRRGRGHLGIVAALGLALVGGGWTARQVLADGPGRAQSFTRTAIRDFREHGEEEGRKHCVGTSQALADAAAAEARTAPDAALAKATAGLDCVATRGDLHDTAVERTMRALLATTRSYLLERSGARVVAAGAQGKSFAWGRDDGTVVIWDFVRASATASEGTAAPRFMAASERGDRLVALDSAGQVRVWNLADPATPQRVILDVRDPGAAALSGDGRVLVVVREAATELRAFDIGTSGRAGGVPLAGPPGLMGPLTGVTVSDDATRVFAASGASVIDWRLGKRKADKPVVRVGHEGVVTALALARCTGGQAERWLLSGDAGGVVRVWDLRARGARAKPRVFTGVEGVVSAIRMTADCRHLVAAGTRGLRVWDLQSAEPDRTPRGIETGGPIGGLALDGGRAVVAAGSKLLACDLGEGVTPCEEFAGHTGPVRALDLTRTSGWAVSVGEDGTVRLWDVRASSGVGSLQAHHDAPVRDMALADQGRVLTASGPDATLWRLSGVRPPERVAVLPGANEHPVRAVALGPNPAWAATAADEPVLTLWRLASEREPSPMPVSTGGALKQLAFSDDGAWLAGIGPQAACAVDMRGEAAKVCLPLAHAGELTALHFVPDTHTLAVGGADREVVLLDLDDMSRGTAGRSLGQGTGVVRAIAASRDGRWLAAGGENADGRLWDRRPAGASPDAGQSPGAAQLRRLGGLTDTVQAMAFSGDHRWLVVGAGRKLYGWDLEASSEPPTWVRELPKTVQALAFDEGHLLSGGADGKVLAWPIATLGKGEPLELGHQRGNVSQLAVTADGDFAVSAGSEATLHVWPLGARPLRELALRLQAPSL